LIKAQFRTRWKESNKEETSIEGLGLKSPTACAPQSKKSRNTQKKIGSNSADVPNLGGRSSALRFDGHLLSVGHAFSRKKRSSKKSSFNTIRYERAPKQKP